ncbi:MAG: glycosyltransferase family 9 protein [Nitrospirae bacterium]|nr:glycosyltransferase family 9 protein [Nitrospirota bacterium]
MIRTTVIIHPGALGDVLLAVPAMKRLRARFPQHQSLLIAGESVSRLLLDCRVIDAWLSLEGASCSGLLAGSIPISDELNDWLGRCDLAVAWTQDNEGTLATVFRSCGIVEQRIQSPFSPELKARHQSDRFVETLGDPPDDLSTDSLLQMSSHLQERGRAYLDRVGIPTGRPLVLVHPGSGSCHKCIRPDVFAEAIEELRQGGIHPLLLEGPADRDSVAGLLELISAKPTVLQGLDLSLLAGVLTQVELYIGQDSGITHLAGLLSVQTIAIFGPTDPDRWAPRGCHVTVLHGAPCACRSWETVIGCSKKPCLAVPIHEILTACRTHGLNAATPRNSTRCALSPPISYARVPS